MISSMLKGTTRFSSAVSAYAPLLLLVCLSTPLWSQVYTASLTGLVRDPSSAAVPGAAVKIRNTETNDLRDVVTSQDGRYTFSQLKPGSYEVVVEVTGFQRFLQPSFTLQASQAGEFDISLTIGRANQTIEVSAAAPVLDTQSADKGVTLSSQAVANLPINLRNPLGLIWQTAGVVAIRTGISQATSEQNQNRFALNGGRDESAAILIDGVPATSGDWGGALATPSVEATQEVQVLRNTFDTQYGRTDGGVVSMVTKGGSDAFHGAIFDYLRNNQLDANTWDNNRAGIKKPVFQRNQFGANVSGPLWSRRHIYFFGGYDATRQGSPTSVLTNLPTTAERGGDFSQTRNSDGSLAVIYNPFTTTANTGGSGYTRQPFANNIIPTSMLNPIATKVLSLWPQPNRAGDPVTHSLNYASGGKNVSKVDRLDARIDWAKSEKWSIFGRFTKAWEVDTVPTLYGNGTDNNYGGENPRHQVVIGVTYVPSASWVTNILVGSGRWREGQVSPSQGTSATTIGFPTTVASQFSATTLPAFTMSSYPQISNPRFLTFPRNTHNLQINNSKQFNAHSLKFGFITEIMQLNSTDVNSPTFSFSRGMTSGPNATTDSTVTGNSIASMLLGTGSGGSAPNSARMAYTEKYWAVYFQDTWRINPRLTFNYGLRYEVQLPSTERYNRLNYFDFNAANPLSQSTGLNLRGGEVFLNGDNRGLWNTDKTNFAPRAGISYKITEKLVARAGYGIFFPPAWVGMAANDGFSVSTPWVTSVGGGGLIPQDTLSNPFPGGFQSPIGSSKGLLTNVGQGASAVSRLHPTPYVQSYSVDFQYQLSNTMMIEVGYSGTQGRKLFYGYSQNVNQLDPQYLSMGSDLNTLVANPFYGKITTGSLAGATIPKFRLLLPYPQFTSVSLNNYTPGASSSYNALLVKVNRRFNKGLMGLVTYSWSKAIDNASETQAWEISDAARNNYNFSGERSISGHDLPQSLTGSLMWTLPVGKGERFLNHMNAVGESIVGGWQIATAVRFGSGLPLQFTASNTLGTYGFPVARPNITNLNDLASGTRTPDHWFNTAAVSAPAPYTIGTAPRWISNIRTGPMDSADLILMKTFKPIERASLQFRAEAFNISNTPQYGRANTSVGSTTFGVITGTTNVGPRNIQLALRLQF